MAALSSRRFIASSPQKTSRAWRRKAGIERPTRSSCKTRCKEQPQSKGDCARALFPHARVALGTRVRRRSRRATKKPGSGVSPGLVGAALLNTLYLEDSRYASQMKVAA